jgi:superfamily II DNA or RNA helicase
MNRNKIRGNNNVERACLSDINLKSEYDTEEDNIIKDFYAPCLRVSDTYDRAVGYFRANIYKELGEDLLNFVIRGGKIRIICSPDIPEEEENAAREGYENRYRKLNEQWDDTLIHAFETMSRNPQELDCLNMLRLLIEKESLDLYVAIRLGGIYHRKIGVFFDNCGEVVVFSGSGNETRRAISSLDFWGNDEEFDVYCSWGNEFEAKKCLRKVDYLERLFAGGTRRTRVRLLTKVEREVLNKFRSHSSFEDCRVGAKMRSPSINEKSANKISPRYFQEEAIKAWKSSGYIGILSMATGTGKTITALLAIKDLLKEGRTILILVPSNILMLQWYNEIRKFYPDVPILLVGGGNNWRANKLKRVFVSDSSLPRFILATMSSASTQDFLEFISQAKTPILVADEVHRLGSHKNRNILEISFDKRLGLSATPERLFDPEGDEILKKSFGSEPVFNLPLGGKVKLSSTDSEEVPIIGTYLSHYDYFFYLVNLTDEEQSEYDDLTTRINQIIAMNNKKLIDGGKSKSDYKLQLLLIKRARIIKQAKGKIACADQAISEKYTRGGKWIIYCDDKKQMNAVASSLRKAYKFIPVLTYHSKMDPEERRRALTFLESNPCIVVSIRCLDEGVDIPSVDGALILASSTNPRQYIQRRGRVLRKAIDKRKSIIVDSIVLPKSNYVDEDNHDSMVKGELARALEFANYADNKDITHDLWKICQEYDVDIESDAKLNIQN